MGKKIICLSLMPGELSILRSILGFVEAGEVSGGPLDGMKHQEVTANVRVFQSLVEKVNRI